jgi:hypothetical protein
MANKEVYHSPSDILWDGLVDSRPSRIIRNFNGGCFVEIFEGNSIEGGYRTAIGDEDSAVYQIAFLHTKKKLDEILDMRAEINAKALERGKGAASK